MGGLVGAFLPVGQTGSLGDCQGVCTGQADFMWQAEYSGGQKVIFQSWRYGFYFFLDRE